MDTTSVSLLQRLNQPGDEAAWRRFARLYTPLLDYSARKLGLGDAERADLVQEVMLTLIEKLPEFQYDRGRSFRGWLAAVASNRCRDYLRRKKITPVQAETAVWSGVDDADNVALFTEQEYRNHLVRQALSLMQAEFEPTTWKACLAVIVEGKSATVAAGDMGISVNAVYLAKSRVLRRLREELAGLLDD